MLPFFVYGTLRQGEANHHLLKNATFSCRPAVMEGGTMYDMGPYPMVVAGNGLVYGEVVEVVPEQYEQTLRRLDILEGVQSSNPENPNALYQRLRTWVTLESDSDGVLVEAWVYIGRERTAKRGRLILGGDWINRFERPQNPRQ